MCISLYHPDFCRVLVSRPDVWRLHECIRLQLLVSHADEPDYFWRELGICCSQYASRSLCAGTGLSISFLREVARCSQLWRSPHHSPLSLVQAGDSSTAEMQLLTFLVQAREFLTREKILLIVPSTSMAKKILDELMEANIEY